MKCHLTKEERARARKSVKHAKLYVALNAAIVVRRRLIAGFLRLKDNDKAAHELFIIQEKPTRGAQPILFCKPTRFLAKHLLAAKALKRELNIK